MNNILKNINSRMSNAKTLIRYFPIVIKKAKGCRITDINNKIYIDCISAAGALPLGHNHEIFKKTLKSFIDNDYPIQTMDIPTNLQHDFLDELYNFVPNNFSDNAKIQVGSPSGADSVESAIKLCKIATGRENIISFSNSYHGQSYGALSLSGRIQKIFPFDKMKNVDILPFIDEKSNRVEVEMNLLKLESILSRNYLTDNNPAAIIIEPIQGEAGIYPASYDWLRGIRDLSNKFKIPLIFDEVQSGFCRTGKNFGFQHYDIIPDVLCIAKAFGGSMPLSAIMFDKKLDVWNEYNHAGTWRGNQISFMSSLYTMQYMKAKDICSSINSNSFFFINLLNDLKNKYDIIRDIRYKGYMIAIEFINLPKLSNRKSGLHLSSELIAKKFQHIAFKNGILLLRCGEFKNIIRIMPPLNTTCEELEIIYDIISKSLQETINKID